MLGTLTYLLYVNNSVYMFVDKTSSLFVVSVWMSRTRMHRV